MTRPEAGRKDAPPPDVSAVRALARCCTETYAALLDCGLSTVEAEARVAAAVARGLRS